MPRKRATAEEIVAKLRQVDVLTSQGKTVAEAVHAEASTPAVDVKILHAKIGQLTLENDFLEGELSKAGLLSVKR